MFAYSADDHRYMARALQQAALAMNTTTPNPRVGCVLVRDGRIIGEGYTRPAGGPHAEVVALRDAADRERERSSALQGATAYVTLEPCSHHGRTPPCAEALVAAGVRRVVAAMQDPNPQVAGAGLARLRAAGIEVACGLMEEAAQELNIGFVSRMTRGRPWLRLKAAASFDGKTALNNGASQWLTGPAARADGHRWRARSCAILSGIGTVREDDPQLTVRLDERLEHELAPRPPLKVIVDSRLDIPLTARLLQDGRTLIAAAQGAAAKVEQLGALGAEVIFLPDAQGKVDLPALLAVLAQRGINEVHGEAGGRLNGALLQAGLVDELLLYLAPTLLGDAARGLFHLPELTELSGRRDMRIVDLCRCGEDIRLRVRPK
ncbi:MAG: bifunctional diaminohydroxyphosphoribosylaminopyrimidine deaminase/5-amino-6-(5-phosphoribosylamino)uracil reductase RibD [Sterolibacterium sp.]|nr:bifunctional diaminohydroxyphosphoribosylaminopyrimidine deaminase/5-amino-6-(5-phosphoribosylamino)uracil reductase RibD [Sterolibacterium sp.]MBP9799531.1 bifunctional diaminohydroxyphosphoribosylaminopyrimidine deaminase/5-amino-6-(5-phosphoribosylamino)uracil reductase RibD [Sterolibacterium sp.]